MEDPHADASGERETRREGNDPQQSQTRVRTLIGRNVVKCCVDPQHPFAQPLRLTL